MAHETGRRRRNRCLCIRRDRLRRLERPRRDEPRLPREGRRLLRGALRSLRPPPYDPAAAGDRHAGDEARAARSVGALAAGRRPLDRDHQSLLRASRRGLPGELRLERERDPAGVPTGAGPDAHGRRGRRVDGRHDDGRRRRRLAAPGDPRRERAGRERRRSPSTSRFRRSGRRSSPSRPRFRTSRARHDRRTTQPGYVRRRTRLR